MCERSNKLYRALPVANPIGADGVHAYPGKPWTSNASSGDHPLFSWLNNNIVIPLGKASKSKFD